MEIEYIDAAAMQAINDAIDATIAEADAEDKAATEADAIAADMAQVYGW